MIRLEAVTSESQWDFFLHLMQESFPISEYRPLDRLKKLSLINKLYKPSIIYKDDMMLGLITFWDFSSLGENFIYLEHFATSPLARNQGLGTKVLDLIKSLSGNIIFEVELPETQESERRIDFYQRNGAKISHHKYSQAPYRVSSSYIPMHLMYFGQAPSEQVVELMMKNVYPIYYVEKYIFPEYSNFDAGHRVDHIQKVIDASINLASPCEDKEMLYFIAAYHDIGLDEGRKFHHLRSAEIFYADKYVSSWFTQDERITMKEAIEDHRASNPNPPRSIYGKIVADADRDITPSTIINRTLQYDLAKFPDIDIHTRYEHFKKHLKEKYGENGYLKLQFPNSPNYQGLLKLQALMRDEKLLKEYFQSSLDLLLK